jgi:hypothetical protein
MYLCSPNERGDERGETREGKRGEEGIGEEDKAGKEVKKEFGGMGKGFVALRPD